MADHGWNADGAGGGNPAGNNKTDDGKGATHGANPNVVPFPGDWIGPLDELVPIHLGEPDDDRPDASSFWDGDSTAIHEAVGAATARGGSWDSSGSSRDTRMDSRDVRSQSRASTFTHRHRDSESGVPTWPAPGRRRARGALIAVGLLFLMLFTGGLVMVISGRSHPTAAGSSSTIRTTRTNATAMANAAQAKRAETAIRRAAAAKRAAAANRAATARRARLASERAAAARRAASAAKLAEARRASLPQAATKPIAPTTPSPAIDVPVDHAAETVTQPAKPQRVETTPAVRPVSSHATPTCAMSPDSGCLP
jgi:hypothetical protein